MSDIDLKKIKQKLEVDMEDVKKRMEALHEDDPFMDPDYASNNAAVDTDVREQEAHQRIEAEITALDERLKDIKTALDRIEKGRYGYCKRCNQPIPAKRLELIPETQYCVKCESELKQ